MDLLAAFAVVDLSPYLTYAFPTWTTYALFFLLGSLTVSGLSDLRRMSAQREFLEIWVLFSFVLAGLDFWHATQVASAVAWSVLAVKWGLIAVLAALSWSKVGVFFRLAAADVWAVIAVCALLSPLSIVVFYALLWVSNLALRPALARFGGRGAYPFIPVVLAAVLATLLLILLRVPDWVRDRVAAG